MSQVFARTIKSITKIDELILALDEMQMDNSSLTSLYTKYSVSFVSTKIGRNVSSMEAFMIMKNIVNEAVTNGSFLQNLQSSAKKLSIAGFENAVTNPNQLSFDPEPLVIFKKSAFPTSFPSTQPSSSPSSSPSSLPTAAPTLSTFSKWHEALIEQLIEVKSSPSMSKISSYQSTYMELDFESDLYYGGVNAWLNYTSQLSWYTASRHTFDLEKLILSIKTNLTESFETIVCTESNKIETIITFLINFQQSAKEVECEGYRWKVDWKEIEGLMVPELSIKSTIEDKQYNPFGSRDVMNRVLITSNEQLNIFTGQIFIICVQASIQQISLATTLLFACMPLIFLFITYLMSFFSCSRQVSSSNIHSNKILPSKQVSTLHQGSGSRSLTSIQTLLARIEETMKVHEKLVTRTAASILEKNKHLYFINKNENKLWNTLFTCTTVGMFLLSSCIIVVYYLLPMNTSICQQHITENACLQEISYFGHQSCIWKEGYNFISSTFWSYEGYFFFIKL